MFIGRIHEIELIQERLSDTTKAQMIVIYGRRRVGKSRLIRESIKREKNVLFFEGIEGADTPTQIDQFLSDLARQTGHVKLAARNWNEALQGLGEIVATGRWILVFDEFPWMAVERTALVSNLKLHWDRWAATNTRVVLFLCGSVASFMVKHIVHSKALHNRKTLEICLGSLLPVEAGKFISKRSITEQANLYMCLGGIPKYLEQIDPSLSVEKNLNRLCFTANGFFVNEYETLFKEQFRSIKHYQQIVELLVQAPHSMSDIARKLKIERGGGLKEYLDNLVNAQMVQEYTPVVLLRGTGLRTKKYKVVDFFLGFYFRYMHHRMKIISRNKGENLFRSFAGGSLSQYFGFAFERLCEHSMDNILRQCGIALADIVSIGPYFQQRTKVHRGLQIDNLVLRRDNVLTIMEYKYHIRPIGIEVIPAFDQKIQRLQRSSNLSVEKVIVTANGVTDPVRKSHFFDHILTLDDLYRLR